MENMQDIFIGDEGRGSPLVLVHGFLGSTEMWGPQIKHFKENFRVLYLRTYIKYRPKGVNNLKKAPYSNFLIPILLVKYSYVSS